MFRIGRARQLEEKNAALVAANQKLVEDLTRERSYTRYLYAELVKAEAKALRQERIIEESKAHAKGIREFCDQWQRGDDHAFRDAGGDIEC